MQYQFDQYTLKARIAPMLLVILPVALIVMSIFPEIVSGWNSIATILGAFGIAALLAQSGRDAGKNKEPYLYEAWGGTPTTLMLSHHQTKLEKGTLLRYHEKAIMLIPSLVPPSAQEESLNPEGAYQIYNSITQYLREKTRDKNTHPLVSAENINYGFRRNLWGLKPAGVGISAIALACSIFLITYGIPGQASVVYPFITFTISLFLLAMWTFQITPQWVRIAADAYAERLICCLDVIEK